MIKAAAAAGAGAWAAPMIIDSLASPAAALTPGPCNYYVIRFSRNGNSANCAGGVAPTTTPVGSASTPGNNVGVCTSYTRVTSATTPVNLTISCTGGADEAGTVTITSPAGCQFQGASAPSPTCPTAPALSAASGTQLVFDESGVGQNSPWFAAVAIAC